jgi:hypothetical protein
MITNADQGILLTWGAWYVTTPDAEFSMATTTGTSVSLSAPSIAGQGYTLIPLLQAQDGSFVGTVETDSGSLMVAFDQTGVRWTVPNEQPAITTADGGVIGQSGTIYDASGNATGFGSLPTYSWPGYVYQNNGLVAQIRQPMVDFGLSFAQFQPGGLGPRGTHTRLVEAKVFVPAEMAIPGTTPLTADFVARLNARYKKAKPGQTIMNALALGAASFRRFLDTLYTTHMFVAYLGHGVAFEDDPVVRQDPNTFHASALGFACQGLHCSQYYTVGQPGDVPNLPKPKVIFFGACGIDATFLADWNLRSTGQAIISPNPYPPPAQPIGPPDNLYHEINSVSAGDDLQFLLDQFLPANFRDPNTTISVLGATTLLSDHDAPQKYGWSVTKGDNSVRFGQ